MSNLSVYVMEIVQANVRNYRICKVFTWKTRLMLSSSVPLSITIESQIKFVETSFHRLLHFFKIIARIEFCKTLSFHFQSFKRTPTLKWCETLALKMEYTGQPGGYLLKYQCSSGNGFSWVNEGLSIDFAPRSRCGVQKAAIRKVYL